MGRRSGRVHDREALHPEPNHGGAGSPGVTRDVQVGRRGYEIRSTDAAGRDCHERGFESALGDGIKRPTSSELPNRPLMRKSLVVRRRIQKGETLTESDLTAKRPGTGLRPALYEQVIGQKASRIIESGEVLTMSSIEWSP